MAEKNQKLELTWIGKDEQPRLEPGIPLEDKLEFRKGCGHSKASVPTNAGCFLMRRMRWKA